MKAVNNSHAIWACLLLALAVAAGAFGAHLLRNVLGERGNEVWKTAVMYHFIHGLAILVFAV
ncbi:MAG: DUF423 domain-containing protein, partial [Flavobacteriales bacterium]|nr:DUF423 domain-containing protein [Flavobacteriales bacterium]